MRKRMMLALILATAVIGPAAAQPSDNARGGVQTETQRRMAQGIDWTFTWDMFGLLGLLGLLGLRREHADDSYHPTSLE